MFMWTRDPGFKSPLSIYYNTFAKKKKNVRFHEDVEFKGEDNIMKVVFEEELMM